VDKLQGRLQVVPSSSETSTAADLPVRVMMIGWALSAA
jgi:hypothetical protein